VVRIPGDEELGFRTRCEIRLGRVLVDPSNRLCEELSAGRRDNEVAAFVSPGDCTESAAPL
jgi:hypothetical protein